MGVIAITMFLGISWLAVHVPGTVASDVRSIPAQIAHAVYGGGIGFYLVQFFTAAILILAANTAYQDFPRLSSILARDRYMPRQFMNRGDRLVFSNGIVVLAIAASIMIFAFEADLTRLIQLYVIGAFATGIVLSVVVISKFTAGGWLSLLFMGILVATFLNIHRHYTVVMRQLRRGAVRAGAIGVNHMVLVVRDLDTATAEALGAIRSIRPTELRIVHPVEEPDGDVPFELQDRWRAFAGGTSRLEPLPLGTGSLLDALRMYVARLNRAPEDFVNVVIPEMVQSSLLRYLLGRTELVRLKAGLLREPNIVVTDVPVMVPDGDPSTGAARPLIPARTVALVFVASVNDAVKRAVNYAETLEASETRAIYFELDPDSVSEIQERWVDERMRVPLDIVEAPFRDLTRPMLEEVRRFTSKPGTLVMVVLPELIVSQSWHFVLHNQNALFVKRLFLFEPNVILSSVPYVLGDREPEAVTAE
jgi:hypothetical protein